MEKLELRLSNDFPVKGLDMAKYAGKVAMFQVIRAAVIIPARRKAWMLYQLSEQLAAMTSRATGDRVEAIDLWAAP